MTTKPRIIRISLTITVDPESWRTTYGNDPAQLSDDVKRYVLSMVQDSAAAEEGAITAAKLSGGRR